MAQFCKFYSSYCTGAPVLNNVNGSLIAILDACLITGFNKKACTIEVTNNIATVTCTNHGYNDNTSCAMDNSITIEGATPIELNGDKLVEYTGPHTFTFNAPGIADGVASGTITCKVSPVGHWEKQFSEGATKAVYRSTHPQSTNSVFRVHEGRTDRYATVSSGDYAYDVDNLSEQVYANGGWFKGDYNTSAKAWSLVSDGRIFYFFVRTAGFGSAQGINIFGDATSYREGDNLFIQTINDTFQSGNSYFLNFADFNYSSSLYNTNSNWGCLSKKYTGQKFGKFAVKIPITSTSNAIHPYPGIVSGGVSIFDKAFIAEQYDSTTAATHTLRGELPGVVSFIHNNTSMGVFFSNQFMSILESQGKKYLLSRTFDYSGGYSFYVIGFKLSDDWRV